METTLTIHSTSLDIPTEPLHNTTHLYVCLFGVDVCWYKRWDLTGLFVAVILTSCFSVHTMVAYKAGLSESR